MKSYKDGIAFQYMKETKYDRASIFQRGAFGPVPRAPVYKRYPDAPRTALPKPTFPETGSLWSILNQRRSKRRYTPEPITIQTLATLLWATQGLTLHTSGYQFRTAPSAGALYPVETYLSLHNVEGVGKGIYHFSVADFALEEIGSQDYAGLLTGAALDQGMVAKSAVLFIWTAVFLRALWKYRDRCVRYVCMDAGHIAQNLQLVATALGLGCCPIGAFYDDEINGVLRVDGEEETAIYLAAVGRVAS